LRVEGSGFRVQGSGFKVQGSRFTVQGSGFRVQGCTGQRLGLKVEDLSSLSLGGVCKVFGV